jgi:hypothetical protein
MKTARVLSGLPHFIGQGFLLAKIISEIRKANPGKYQFEYDRVCGVRGGLILAAAATLWDSARAHFHPNMGRLSTFVACTTYVHLAAVCEAVMEDVGYSFPGILYHPPC